MDPSPRDHQSSTCVICTFSDQDRMAHLTPRGNTRNGVSSSTIEILHHPRRSAGRHVDASGASDFHQTHGYDSSHDLHRVVAIKRWTHLTIGRTASRDCHRPLTGSAIGRRRQDVEEPPITVQSSRDRAAIALLSLGNRLQSIGRRSMKDQDHDHGSIAARSWRDRGGNRGYLEAKLKLNSRRFVAELKPRSMPTESPPRRH